MIWKDKTFIGLNLSVFMIMIGVGMIVAVLPQRIIELDGHGRNVGYLASMFAVGYIALQAPVGMMADRFGFKLFLAAGYLLCFAAGLCFYRSAGSVAIFCSRLLQGAGEVPIWALAPALLSVKFPEKKGVVIGAYNAVFHVGLTVGPLLGMLLAKSLGRERMFLLYALTCLAGAAVIWFLVEDVRGNGRAGSFDASVILRMARDGRALTALLGITLYGAGYGVFLTTMPAYLLRAKGFGQGGAGVFFSMFYVAISASQLFTGRLADRFGPAVFMAAGLAAAGLGLGSSPFAGRLGILAALTVASMGLGVFHLASMIFLNEIVDAGMKGTISGAYYLFWGIGMFFGPPALSNAAERVGYDAPLIACALLFIALAAVTAVTLPRKTT
jgi:MFS family permease